MGENAVMNLGRRIKSYHFLKATPGMWKYSNRGNLRGNTFKLYTCNWWRLPPESMRRTNTFVPFLAAWTRNMFIHGSSISGADGKCNQKNNLKLIEMIGQKCEWWPKWPETHKHRYYYVRQLQSEMLCWNLGYASPTQLFKLWGSLLFYTGFCARLILDRVQLLPEVWALQMIAV